MFRLPCPVQAGETLYLKVPLPLKQRMDIFAEEAERLLWDKGTSEQEIGDFLAGFHVYDDLLRTP